MPMLGGDLKKVRRLNVATHRDLGYFFTFLIIIYCISGLALNHADDWNPDFIISKDTIKIDKQYSKSDVNDGLINSFNKLVHEEKHRIYDLPTSNQVKIYYKDASFHVYLNAGIGVYEQISKRQVFYQTNVLHRNSLKGWKWVSDIFAIMLIVLSVTGLFILKGKHGLGGRGKWLVGFGIIPPIVGVVWQALL